jgi:protein-S-isoprenylcysteine O-methyltransferase Ste14
MTASIYLQIIVAAWLVFLVVWLIGALGAKRSTRRSWASLGIRIAFIVLVLYLVEHHDFIALGIGSPLFQTTQALAALGAGLAALGVALAIWARFYLGRNWGMPMSHRVEPELVTTGPYAYIRHPIYTGILLAFLGSGLAGAVWGLVLLVGFSIYFVYSASVEERDMASKFPSTYLEYKQRTNMLIPWVW